MAQILTFKPQKITSQLISCLNERNTDVLTQRYGLDGREGKTLEAIGQKYGITRERVRQIENYAINAIKQDDVFGGAQKAFAELEDAFEARGKFVAEDRLLNELGQDDDVLRNNLYFLLVLGDSFTKMKEDDSYNHRWTTDNDLAAKIHSAFDNLHKKIDESILFTQEQIISAVREHAAGAGMEHKNFSDDIILSWLDASKIIDSNPMGEFGHADSANISPRGARDYAYLVLKKHSEPMHFTEIAKKIGDYFKDANASTVHNELIKDDKFVLVGRGIYALKSWGYETGTVRDIIQKYLETSGPLTKEEIIKAVLDKRQIKENTILVNLHDRRFFKKNDQNRYVSISK